MCKEPKNTDVDEDIVPCVEEDKGDKEPKPLTGWDTESDGFWL